MTTTAITNDNEHEAALHEIERLWDATAGSPEADRLEVLVTLVDAHEDVRYQMNAPDPIKPSRKR